MTAHKADLIRSLRLDATDHGGANTPNSGQGHHLDRMAANRRSTNWGLIAGGVLLLGIAALAFWFYTEGQDEAAEATTNTAELTNGQTQTPASTTGSSASLSYAELTASGYVVARRQATVAAEITGRLIEVRIEEGQQVRQGEVLAVLDANLARSDQSVARSRTAAAAAQIDGAEAALIEAAEMEGRVKELFSRGFSTRAAVIEAEARHASQRSALAAAKANLSAAMAEEQRAALQVGRHVIRAPFSGLVIDKNAQAGEIISPISAGAGFTRTGIGTLVDISSIEVEVDVSERYVSKVEPGQKVEILLVAYPDRKMPGTVIAIVPAADRNRSTFRVRIRFDEFEEGIFPDMAAQVGFLSNQTRNEEP